MISVFFGAEPYCIENEIKKATLNVDAMNVFSFDVMDSEFYELAIQFPLMGDKQVFIVHVEKLPTQEEADRFIAFAKKCPDTTDIVLVVAKMDKRSKVANFLSENGGIVKEFPKVSEEVLASLIKDLCSRNEVTMTDEVVKYFIRYIGYLMDENMTLFTVNTAVKQLCFASDCITKEDVNALITQSSDASVWNLSTLLLEREGEKMFQIAQKLLDKKEAPIAMLSLVLRSFRLAYKASMTRNAKEIGVPYYQIEPALRYSSEQISSAMSCLQKGISDIKAGRASADVVFHITLANCLVILS